MKLDRDIKQGPFNCCKTNQVPNLQQIEEIQPEKTVARPNYRGHESIYFYLKTHKTLNCVSLFLTFGNAMINDKGKLSN